MTPETLKRLEELNEQWANEPFWRAKEKEELTDEVMDHLPDLIAAVKERDAAQKACAEKDAKIAALWVALMKCRCSCYIVGTDEADGGCPTEIKCPRCSAIENMDDCGKGYHHEREIEPLVEALKQCIKQCDYMPAHEALAQWEKEGK